MEQYFKIYSEFKQDQIIFIVEQTIGQLLKLQCKLLRTDCNWNYLSFDKLKQLLHTAQANSFFEIHSFQLKIRFIAGAVLRFISIPVINDISINQRIIQDIMTSFQKRIASLQLQGEQNSKQLKLSKQKLQRKKQKNKVQYLQISKRCNRYREQITLNKEQSIKLQKQIITLDEEIISCKKNMEYNDLPEEQTEREKEVRKQRVYLHEICKIIDKELQQRLKNPNMIEVLQLEKKELKAMRLVEIFTRVTQLNLKGNLIRKIEGLHSLIFLNSLDLSNNLIDKIQNLDNNINLKQLFLQKNKIKKISQIYHLKSLQVLALSQNSIEQVHGGLKKLLNLSQIRLINNSISYISGEILLTPNLKVFSILGNPCFRDNHRAKQVINKLVQLGVFTCCGQL